jgi:DNA-binding GntR family transcriptional regulator
MSTPQDWPSGRLVDEIAELMRERIIQGAYAPGAALSQRRLADELSLSRTVIGEALRTLERDGLVTVAPPGRGVRVASSDASPLLSAYALREVVDGLAGRLAALHAGPALEAILHATIDDQRAAVEAGDDRWYTRANISFHSALIEGCGNQFLRGQLPLVRSTARSAGQLVPGRAAEAIVEHAAIFDAVCRRRPHQAERAARAHVRATIAAVGALIDERRDRNGAR